MNNPAPDDEPVSRWLEKLKGGDQEAARLIFDSYYPALRDAARRRLRLTATRDAGDVEDVVLSAFKSFCLRLRQEQFKKMADRKDLWQVLQMINRRKAAELVRGAKRKKRDEDRLVEPDVDGNNPIDGVASPNSDPTAEIDATDLIEHCLSLLSETERELFLLKLAGQTNKEIATKRGTSLRSVERMWNILKARLREAGDDAG